MAASDIAGGASDWVYGGLVTFVMGLLAYIGRKAGTEPPRAVAEIRGSVLMDSAALDPMRASMDKNTAALLRLAEAFEADAETRAKDGERREMRQEVEAERRMLELTGKLERYFAEKESRP